MTGSLRFRLAVLLAGLLIGGLAASAGAQTIAPSERSVSAGELQRVVSQLVSQYETRIRSDAQRVATQQAALRRSEAELRAQVEYFRSKVEALAHDPDPRRQQALADYAAGRQVEAIDTLIAIQRAEDMSDAFARSEHWRQIAALATGVDTGRAADALQEALRYSPNDFHSWLWLSELFNALGRRDEALGAANNAVRLAPTDLARYQALIATAKALYLQGRLEDARPYFENARAALLRLLSASTADIHRELIFFGMSYGAFLADTGDLEASRQWWSRFLPILTGYLDDPALGADAAVVYFVSDGLAAVVSSRLGYGAEATALAHALTARAESMLGPSPQSQQLMALAFASLASGTVELRFGDLDRGIASSRRTAQVMASLNASDPSNTAYAVLRMIALTQIGWGQVLAGRANEADQALAQAIDIGMGVQRAHPGEVQSTLLLGQAHVYRGMATYLTGDHQRGERYMQDGLAMSAGLSDLARQNAAIRRGVWAQRAVASGLGVGEDWRDFLATSQSMVRDRTLTASELEYMQQVRSQVLAQYHVEAISRQSKIQRSNVSLTNP